jgi:hypothetical protein
LSEALARTSGAHGPISPRLDAPSECDAGLRAATNSTTLVRIVDRHLSPMRRSRRGAQAAAEFAPARGEGRGRRA